MVYERVLVPVDRNETTPRAVEWGVAIGEHLEVPVDLLHVAADGSGHEAGSRPAGGSRTAVAAFPDEIERVVADAAGTADRHVVSGVPQEAIRRFAEEQDIDLIVMGQDGKTGVNNHLFDSVVDKVVRTTAIPVLAIPEGDGPCRVDRVLLPISDRLTSDEAIRHAATAATAFGMTVHVVSVVDTSREGGPFDAGGVTDGFIDRLRADARPAIDRTVERLVDLGVETEIETDVVHGLPHDALDEYVTAHDIDLVIASGYGDSRVTRRVFGDLTEHLLQTTSVPVFVA